MVRFWDRYGRSYREKSTAKFDGYIKYTIQRINNKIINSKRYRIAKMSLVTFDIFISNTDNVLLGVRKRYLAHNSIYK